jgi:ParB family chromosome partitioning protein
MEKRGLGRGLAALISETMTGEDTVQVREIPVSQVVPNPFQPRTLFDPIKLEELVASIREHGILQPVLVKRVGHERYQLVAGERRFRAAQSAGLSSIPALVKEMSEQEQLEIAVVENVQREDIGVMESARAYRRLIDEFGMTQETVSQRVGKSRSAIANVLRLLKLPAEIQESVERGEISEGHGRALMMIEEPGAIQRAWQTVLKKRLSVRETELLAKEIKEEGRPASVTPSPSSASTSGSLKSPSTDRLSVDPNEAALAESIQQYLGTKVSLRSNANGSGKIEIEFFSLQDLERIAELILHGH